MVTADILAFLVKAMETIPGLFSAGMDIAAFVQKTTGQVQDMQANNRAPTQQEWDELDAQAKSLQGRLHSP